MTYKCFKVDQRDGVAHVQMSRPEKANSMNSDFWKELPAIIAELDSSGDVRVCILSGQGKNFSGGMDLEFFAQPEFSTMGEARQREFTLAVIQKLQNAFDAFDSARFPIIAAIQGSCIGGALDMIAACDLRYACSDARFCIEEINIGMMADLGSLQRLPYIIPEGVLRELAYTGSSLNTARALELDLINQSFENYDEMMEAVQGIAANIASKSPISISATKRSFTFSRNHGLTDSLAHARLLQAAFFEPKDVMSAVKAKMSRTTPSFENIHASEFGEKNN